MNDTLTQIERCWRYATLTKRTLVIDTGRSGGFKLPFGRFFVARDPARVVLHPSPVIWRELEGCDVRPSFLRGRLHDYMPVFSPEVGNFVDRENGGKLSFDFERDHPERLLVHDQCGGRAFSIDCLARLKLTNDFRRDVLATLEPLSEGAYYSAVVRHNSDYQTDYRAFFDKLHPHVTGRRLLLCSDNPEVLGFASERLEDVDLVFLSETPDSNGVPYATWSAEVDEAQKYRLVLKAVSDLIGLANAHRLFASRLKDRKLGLGGVSGFAVLALELYKRKRIIGELLGR